MEKYDNLYSLMENIESLMDGLLLSGFTVINTGTLKVIENNALDCEKAGLSFAANILKEIALGQERKRHDMSYNCEDILGKYFILSNYINIIKSKLEVEKAKSNLI